MSITRFQRARSSTKSLVKSAGVFAIADMRQNSLLLVGYLPCAPLSFRDESADPDFMHHSASRGISASIFRGVPQSGRVLTGGCSASCRSVI